VSDEAPPPSDPSDASEQPDPSAQAPAEPATTGAERGLRGFWRNPANRFVVLFVLFLLLLVVGYPPLRERYTFVVEFMAELTALFEYWTLGIFTDKIRVDGDLVVYHGFAVKIIEECTGIYEILIFWAAVLAFPATWTKKAIGIVLGAVLLYGINVLRILLLIHIGKFHHELFDFMHLYFMQATLILMITSVWILWIFKVVRYGEDTGRDPSPAA